MFLLICHINDFLRNVYYIILFYFIYRNITEREGEYIVNFTPRGQGSRRDFYLSCQKFQPIIFNNAKH